jgi:hypothetical protein
METLKAMGAVAGIGGLALGVVLILFRDVIRQILVKFPGISRQHAYQLIRLFLILVWSIGVIGIGAWVTLELQPKSIPPTPPAPTPSPVATSTPTPSPTPETVTVNYTVCLGEYERNCGFAHDVYLYCGGASEAEAYFRDKCLRVEAKQIGSRGGNKCGYANVSVVCVRKKP